MLRIFFLKTSFLLAISGFINVMAVMDIFGVDWTLYQQATIAVVAISLVVSSAAF